MSTQRWTGLPVEERALERRALLVDAAFELLGTQGDAATTVRAVCQRARLNPRYFYESFADRDALLVAVYDHQTLLLGLELFERVEGAGSDPEAIARAGIDTVCRWVAADPRRARVLYSEALGNEAVARRRLETMRSISDFIGALALQHHGPPPAGEHIGAMATSLLVGGMSELLMAWLDGRLDVGLDQLIDDTVALFLAVGEAADSIASTRIHTAT